ncbi:MAG: DNA mismatch repair protein MutS [Candidatus Margulisbacteria bacterium]|nr:DNA mismatch repair protein MutS [Candidatus Margulisiibacteriota bacterium]
MADLSPMVKQYLAIKEKHKDAILFYRLGDFYEMFNRDAETASRELDLVLTGRGQEDNRMPMCGIPYHAAENYIAKLIAKGYKVAICEQTEDPSQAKGIVKREVIRIITPGTLIESNLLPSTANNYLLAIMQEKNIFGLAYIDASTGEFMATEIESEDKLLDEINRINPAEILISDLASEKARLLVAGFSVVTEFKDTYDLETAEEKLKDFFKVKSLDAFGLSAVKMAWGAAAAILDYLKETQKSNLGQVNYIRPYQADDFMLIDASTRRNLELTQTIRDKSLRGSLLWVLDKTKTSMGGRLLRQWVLQPLLDIEKINQRLDAVNELYQNAVLRAEVGSEIKQTADLERVVGRVASASANARDLLALKETLQKLPKIKQVMSEIKSAMLAAIRSLPDFNEAVQVLEKSIAPDPPFTLKDGGIIKTGFNAELDEIKKAAAEGKNWIAQLENEERRKTGIKSLKVGFTKVFGYYIEVTNTNLAQVPENYIRKQTLINCERFITPELKEKESLILHADERMKEMEYKVFCGVREEIAKSAAGLQQLAQAIAKIDVLLSLAEVAVENRYCFPLISRSPDILISGSRHPVVEKTLGEFNFVPNNVKLNDECRFMLITGPNMAGKSTYMRQAALICLLAQIGSFVPAREAKLCLVDRIFTRIGAMDDIFSGQSTFMLEMTETANILHNATEKSLIILDEIGRGTATFDGMSIAAAVAEYIYEKIKTKTLFATHYHEITQLADKHPGMKNYNVLVKEAGDQITFLHKIAEGPADRSYGIQVAQLAGLPKEVVDRSKEIYATLEMVENDLGEQQRPAVKSKLRRPKSSDQNQVSLF